MLQVKGNLLYFHFLALVVNEMETLNSAFQSSRPNLFRLNQQLNVQLQSLKSRIFFKDGGEKPICYVDFGFKFSDVAKTVDVCFLHIQKN